MPSPYFLGGGIGIWGVPLDSHETELAAKMGVNPFQDMFPILGFLWVIFLRIVPW